MRRPLAAAAFVLVVCAAMGFGAPVVSADAPAQQGWWTALSVTTPLGEAVASPKPADVPANGLLIEGGPSTPVAYAAVAYYLAEGATASTLSLPVAPNSGTTPNTTLQLCALTAPAMHAEQGGPMSDAPAYSCAKKVTAQQSSAKYRFDVSGLASNGAVAVAILPTASTDRVVLSPPDNNSLATSGSGTGSTDTSGSLPSADNTGPPGSTSVGLGDSGIGALPVGPAIGTPSESGSPAVAASGQSPSAAVGAQPATPLPAVASLASSPAKPLAVLLVVFAVLLGGAAWSSAGHAAVQAAAGRLSGSPEES